MGNPVPCCPKTSRPPTNSTLIAAPSFSTDSPAENDPSRCYTANGCLLHTVHHAVEREDNVDFVVVGSVFVFVRVRRCKMMHRDLIRPVGQREPSHKLVLQRLRKRRPPVPLPVVVGNEVAAIE